MSSIISTNSRQTYGDNAQSPPDALTKLGREWNRVIRRELHHFAQNRWPNAHFLGIFSFHTYRLRKQHDRGVFAWWVERDIPPYDRYRCEAFRVELRCAKSGQPRLLVRTGSSVYRISSITQEALYTTLARADADAPLLIQRQFGPALDP